MQLMIEPYSVMIFYDFKVGVNQEEYLQRLQLAYGNEALPYVAVFSWF